MFPGAVPQSHATIFRIKPSSFPMMETVPQDPNQLSSILSRNTLLSVIVQSKCAELILELI